MSFERKHKPGRNDYRKALPARENEESRIGWLKKLTLNKWSLTFAVILVMLSAWLGLKEVEQNGLAQQEVLYVTDTVPYDIQRVNADANAAGGENQQNGENQQDGEEQQPAAADTEEGENAEDNQEQQVSTDGGENYSINSDSDFFINYRLEREKARSRQLELLQSLIDDEKTTDEMRAEAQQKVIEQATAIEQELMLESILVAQYGGEAVVFVQPEKVNVVLELGDKSSIADQEAEKIARLMDNYTGIGFENVIIVLKD